MVEPATGQQTQVFNTAAWQRYQAGVGLDPRPLDWLKAISDSANSAGNLINAINNGGQGAVAQPVSAPVAPAPAPQSFLAGIDPVVMIGGAAVLLLLLMR